MKQLLRKWLLMRKRAATRKIYRIDYEICCTLREIRELEAAIDAGKTR